MMEWFVLITAFLFSGVLALVKSLNYYPSGHSASELDRKVKAGEAAAQYEAFRRPLLPTLIALRTLKEVVLTIALAWLLLATHELWPGLLLLLFWLLVAEIITVRGWVQPLAAALQRRIEPSIIHLVASMRMVWAWLAPRRAGVSEYSLASKEELRELVQRDTAILSSSERARVISGLDFDTKKISDVMVPRERIVTVTLSETVGPVLLDRLHTAGHSVFPVIKKDLDHIEGFLYMRDVVSPHPEVKTVEDAVRPLVHYVQASAPLSEVLSAALDTGRQLFIVKGTHDKVTGLITLSDVLVQLTGGPMIKTDPAPKKNA